MITPEWAGELDAGAGAGLSADPLDLEWIHRLVAPSGDAVFAAVGALGVALVAEGANRDGTRAAWFGIAAGLLLGCLLFLTYLGAMLLVIPAVLLLAALVRRERGAWLVVMAGVAAGLAVVAAFWIAGFWWLDGVDATREQYHAGSAGFRRWSYFAIGNLGAALFALGPVTVVGMGTLRSRRMWLLVGGATVALTASHLSTYTKGEVERIWLIFYPWLALAGAALVSRRRRWSGAGAVAVQATCAIVLQAALVSKW